jgi:hypothetical protein
LILKIICASFLPHPTYEVVITVGAWNFVYENFVNGNIVKESEELKRKKGNLKSTSITVC